ncbi:MAG: acyl-CoA thioesterase [Prevotellaceae bacterium]|jgi:acyl-CoA thioester hydrolase|nr:acyl-CoA thioesterase [Prevotellaceae bacterium]
MNNLKETVIVQVRFSEVDALRMVWHGNYLRYLEDAREAFGRKYGLDYRMIFDNGYITPVVDMHLEYKQPATMDDILDVEICYRAAKGGKIIFDYTIYKQKDKSLVLTAGTIQLFMTVEGVFEPSCPNFYAEWKRKWHQL